MKSMALFSGVAVLAGLAIGFGSTAQTTTMQERNQPPSQEVKLAKTGWKLPTGHTTEWAIFGSG